MLTCIQTYAGRRCQAAGELNHNSCLRALYRSLLCVLLYVLLYLEGNGKSNHTIFSILRSFRLQVSARSRVRKTLNLFTCHNDPSNYFSFWCNISHPWNSVFFITGPFFLFSEASQRSKEWCAIHGRGMGHVSGTQSRSNPFSNH